MQIHYYDACIRTLKKEKWLLIWLWGCRLHCPGCANLACKNTDYKQTEAFHIFEKKITGYAGDIAIKGLIISGGEPFEQPEALSKLIQLAKKNRWYTIVYTGYSMEEIRIKHTALLHHIGVLIDGPFMESEKVHHAFYGSKNQKMYILHPELAYLKNVNAAVSYYTKSLNGDIMHV